MLCAQAWKPSSQHAGEKRGVAGLLLGRTERAARAAELQLCAHGKYDTVIVFKKKRRTRYERRNGHRQGYTEVLVTELRSGAESAVVDPQVITRNRARVAALAKQKVQNKPLTRKEKIAQGLPKPAKVKKNSLRKAKEA